MNDLIQGVVGGAAPKINDQVTTLVDMYQSQIIEEKFGSPMLPELPPTAHKVLLSAESSLIFETLKPVSYSQAGMERCVKLIAAMLGGYPQLASMDAQSKQKMMAAYTAKLSDLPLFAIAEACEAIMKGSDIAKKVEVRPSFAPTDTQVYQIADMICGKYRAAKAQIDRILSINNTIPKPLPPQDRERMAKLMSGLAAQLRAPIDAENSERRQRADSAMRDMNIQWIMREYRHHGLEPRFDKSGNLISLALLLRSGYSITERMGVRVLLSPTKDRNDDDQEKVSSSKI